MNRKRFFVAFAVVLLAIGVTVGSILRETSRDELYGATKIRLLHTSVYVKQRQCPGCSQRIWLTRESHRCTPPDPTRDYSMGSNDLLYTRDRNTLLLSGYASNIARPTSGDWIDMRFAAPNSGEADRTHFKAITFSDSAIYSLPVERVSLSPCVRAFGHAWTLF